MIDAMNTKNGRYGFVAVYPGGKRYTELQMYWDQLAKDEVLVALEFVDFEKNEVLLSLEGFDGYFFSNEAMNYGGTQLSGKYFGAFNMGEPMKQVKVDMLNDPPTAAYSEVAIPSFNEPTVRRGFKLKSQRPMNELVSWWHPNRTPSV